MDILIELCLKECFIALGITGISVLLTYFIYEEQVDCILIGEEAEEFFNRTVEKFIGPKKPKKSKNSKVGYFQVNSTWYAFHFNNRGVTVQLYKDEPSAFLFVKSLIE